MGLSDSVPATCFPPAVGLGATWDVDLLEEVGAALGRETAGEDVGVLLGPGLNIKRHPAGGRCFEYFSEDPLLSGKAAAAMVRGIQSEGVGACLKHYAVNNQEAHRMRLDTIVDERTLREIYLAGFEIAVTEAEPWTVMCAYNLVNGEHAGESRTLLTGHPAHAVGLPGPGDDRLVRRRRPAGRAARRARPGDAEQRGCLGLPDPEGAESGAVAEADLDLACTRVVELALRVEAASARSSPPVDLDAHHALARRAASRRHRPAHQRRPAPAARRGPDRAVGAFAAVPRYQGAGSSQVTPTRVDAALDAMRARLGDDAELVYAPGYDPVTGETTPALLDEARRAVEGADAVVVLVGLPASYESEGFDRTDLRLPAGHDALVEAVTGGECAHRRGPGQRRARGDPLGGRPAALVEAYLGGQAGGSALVDVLFGDAEPGGRLAESFPVSVADLPAHARFANHPTQVQYRENLYVGYRFHDTFDVAPRFAFGHGLTYTTFEYSDLAVTGTGTDRTVALAVTNTGERPGSEVVQVYVHDVASTLHRPDAGAEGFAKVHLRPGESREVAISLDRRAFAVYDVADAALEGRGRRVRGPGRRVVPRHPPDRIDRGRVRRRRDAGARAAGVAGDRRRVRGAAAADPSRTPPR